MPKIETETMLLRVKDGTEMQAYAAWPEDNERHPCMLVLQEAFGVNEYIKSIVDRFAQEGYVAIAPELFHRTAEPGFSVSYSDFPSVQKHMAGLTDDTLIMDMTAAFEWLQASPRAKKGSVGAVGFCMGGRAAFLANAALPLKASVSFYGGGIAQTQLHRTKDLHAPQMFLWGGQDKHILPEHQHAVIAAMKKEGRSFVNVEFSDADHGFFCDARPAYNAAASKEAWALVKDFLKQRL